MQQAETGQRTHWRAVDDVPLAPLQDAVGTGQQAARQADIHETVGGVRHTRSIWPGFTLATLECSARCSPGFVTVGTCDEAAYNPAYCFHIRVLRRAAMYSRHGFKARMMAWRQSDAGYRQPRLAQASARRLHASIDVNTSDSLPEHRLWNDCMGTVFRPTCGHSHHKIAAAKTCTHRRVMVQVQ